MLFSRAFFVVAYRVVARPRRAAAVCSARDHRRRESIGGAGRLYFRSRRVATAARIAEVDRHIGRNRDLGVECHLMLVIPRERRHESCRQALDAANQRA